MPKETTHPRRWVERKLPDGTRIFGSRNSGEGGTISFLANGKVAVGVGGLVFFKQGRKLIRRFKAHPELFDVLENILEPPALELGCQLANGCYELVASCGPEPSNSQFTQRTKSAYQGIEITVESGISLVLDEFQ